MTKYDKILKDAGKREKILNILDIVEGEKIYDVKCIFSVIMQKMNSSAEVDINEVRARIEAVGDGD